MTQTAKIHKQRDYPKYSSAKSALEHFRLIGTLFKYDGIPASYLQHIKDEIARFDKVKEQSKQTAMNLKNVKNKLGELIEKAVINHINDESFGLSLKTTKTPSGVEIDKYHITKHKDNKTGETSYDVMEVDTETLLYYDIHLYEIAFLLTANTMDGHNKKSKINQELLKNNLQYSQLKHSIRENTRKLNNENTTDLEQEAINPIIDSLKNQLLMVKQLVNAQYKHRINAKKA
tara:strand:+ start:3553 stop:4248 length:696 start_codon:yes stop_codon:yes gene_type:complete